MTLEQILADLAAQCEMAGSQAAWAKAHGVSPGYVSDVLARRREPAGKLLAALGLARVVTYAPVEAPKRRRGK